MLTALSAFAFVMQAAQHQLANPAWRHIRPSVHDVVLSQLWHIHESVIIAVMVGLTVLEVEQGGGGETVGQVYASVEIYFCFQLAVLIDVRPESVRALRLQKLNVYLTRGALISVLTLDAPLLTCIDCIQGPGT